MSIKDLSILVRTDLRSDKVQRLNPRACSANIRLEVGEINSLFDQAQGGDPDLIVYLGALLLVKLDSIAPQGTQILPVFYKACTIIQNLRPQLIPSMALCLSSIVSTEISEAQDDQSVIDWLMAANYTMQFEGATKAPRSATNVRLALMFGPRITRICREITGEYVLQTLEYLLIARRYGFMLDDISMIVAKASADFIDERTDKRKNRYSYPPNPDEDYCILEKIKAIGLTNYETLQRDITRLTQIIVPVFVYVVDTNNLAQPNPVFSADKIHYIKASDISITNMAFFARKTDHFQVAVHKGMYKGNCVAVKMYDPLSKPARTEEVEREIKCYQFLSNMSNNKNCFLKYYGTYREGSSLNLVMDYYERDLMSMITEKAKEQSVIHDQTLATIFMNLLKSFSEMEAMGIFHGDIKPHNILTDQYWNMKIIDFSVSVVRNTDITDGVTGKNPVQGTIGYMAPELEALAAQGQNIGIYSPERADVFSLGLVFLQILTLRRLEGLNTFNASTTLMNTVGSLPVKYEWAKRLLVPMLCPDYRQRPRFRDCFQYIENTLKTISMAQR